MLGHVLIVDDEKLTRVTLQVELRDEGFEVWTAANGYEAVEILEREVVDVVISDVRMPSMDGLEFQGVVRQRWPDVEILFMTAFGTVATAVEAMRAGAADYLTKPLHPEEVVSRVKRLVERRRDREQVRRLRAKAEPGMVGDLVYRSPVMTAVVERALSVAAVDLNVLIEGETGTGKDAIARLIHDQSARAAGPFVAINCAGLNPNLIESELFGHEAGAFTGAMRLRQGRFEYASGGTLVIDEVDDLPLDIQVRLLRFLQDHKFERVGGTKTLTSDIRVLCATKRSLVEMVKSGTFRQDLYYRINSVVISLPPLRNRRDEIIPLAEHFAKQVAASRGLTVPPEITLEALSVLTVHDWPGNVRELQHAIEHAVTFARGAPIGLAHLPESIVPKQELQELFDLKLGGLDAVSYTEAVASFEKRLLDWALRRSGGNQVRAAEVLRLSRTTLRSKLAALKGGKNSDPPS